MLFEITKVAADANEKLRTVSGARKPRLVTRPLCINTCSLPFCYN
jgi:hypothetical protein